MDDIVLVPTREEHVAGYNRILDVVARERRYFSIVEGPPVEKSIEAVRSVIANAGVHVVAVHATEGVVGWCNITRHEREGFRHGGRLAIGILQAFRGKGLGERLMTTALEMARAKGFERVELEVFASNTHAAALYERLGFVREGVRRRARKLDGTYDDDILMALLFDEVRAP